MLAKLRTKLFKGGAAKSGFSLRMAVGLPLWVTASFIAAQLALLAILWVLAQLSIDIPTEQAAFSTSIAAGVYILTLAIAIGVPYLVRRYKTTRVDVGLQRLPEWTDIALAPAAAIVYLIMSGLLLALATHYFPNLDIKQVQETGFANLATRSQFLLAFITLVVLAPLAEEILFRGYLYGKLRRYASVWLSVLVTSGLFAVAHGQWNVGIDVFALSLVLCTLREVTGSIWAGVLLHSLKNAVAFYFLFINPASIGILGG